MDNVISDVEIHISNAIKALDGVVSREASLVKTKLQEANMWYTAHLENLVNAIPVVNEVEKDVSTDISNVESQVQAVLPEVIAVESQVQADIQNDVQVVEAQVVQVSEQL